MALSTTQYGYIIDPMVPFTDDKGKTIKNGFVRVFVAGSSTPVITYRNFDGAANQDRIELDNSGRTKTSVIGSKGLTYKVCVYDKHHSQESPILTVDKVSVIGANITAGAGATVVTGLDGLTTKPDGFVDASVIGTDGYVALDHTLVTDDLDTDAKVTAVEDDRYIPLLNDDVNDPDSKITLGRLWQWVLGKIKSLSTTITAFRTGDVIPVDGPSGTAKMPADRIAERNDVGYTYVKSTSDGSVNLSESFTSGQKILIVATTDSDVTATINGNVVFTDSTTQYPTISVVNGFGYKELSYNKDGHLGTFGGAGVSGKKVVFKVVVCDEIEESAFYYLFNLHNENATDINVTATNVLDLQSYTDKNAGTTKIKESSEGSVDLSAEFTANQKILICAFMSGGESATINGNVIFTDSSVIYPTISVVNGFGYKELAYNKDGHLSTFGGAEISGKKVVFKIVICDEAGESALYSLLELHQKNLSAITTNASDISNNKIEIAKNDGVEYIKNTSDGSVNLSETFTSGQKILVVAYTDSDVTATINGNAIFTDSSVQYPTISVVNGFGYKELTYNKDGHLGTFGGAGVSGKKVVFKVVVCDEEGESTLYGLINVIKEIADLHVEQTPNVFASFKKIAIVGDSLGSGESVYKDSSNQFHYVDNYDYSWIQIMAKQNGQTAYNFSKGGEWCADWLDPSNTRGITMAQSNPADCYFIGLGHNDSHVDRQETQPLGTIADVNVGSEGSNPSTFYGNYSKIIASLKAITNRSRIFCVTSPSLESSAPQFNQAIRDVAGLYSMCYVLELGGDPYYASSFIESQKYAGHYSAAAYAAMATHINELLNDYIISHPSDFRGIQWIGTNYDVVDGG